MRILLVSFLLLAGCAGNRAFEVTVLDEGSDIRWGTPSNGLVAGVANETPRGRSWVKLACYLKNVSDRPVRVLAPGGKLQSPAAFGLEQRVSGKVSDTPDRSDEPRIITLAPGETHRTELPLVPEVQSLPYEAETRFVYTNVATQVISGNATAGELWTGRVESGALRITAAAVVRKGIRG